MGLMRLFVLNCSEFLMLFYYFREFILIKKTFFFQKMEVFAPPGNLIGTIEQEWSLFYPKFKIKDSTEKTVLKIKGPFCSFGFCGQSEFQV